MNRSYLMRDISTSGCFTNRSGPTNELGLLDNGLISGMVVFSSPIHSCMRLSFSTLKQQFHLDIEDEHAVSFSTTKRFHLDIDCRKAVWTQLHAYYIPRWGREPNPQNFLGIIHLDEIKPMHSGFGVCMREHACWGINIFSVSHRLALTLAFQWSGASSFRKTTVQSHLHKFMPILKC